MRRATLRWLTGAICLFVAVAWLARRSYPPVPSPLELRLSLPRAEAGRSQPLIVTGQTSAGTLLYVRYTGPETVVFGYDSWAVGGPESPEIRIRPEVIEDFTVAMPALGAPPRVDRKARGSLRVDYAGRTVLAGDVHYHGREPQEIHFGENPIGGTITNSLFRGRITTRAGVELRGRPEALFPAAQRIADWGRREPIAALLALVVAALGGWWLPLLGSRLTAHWRGRREPKVAVRKRPPHGTFAATASVCAILFSAVISGWNYDLLARESFGQFYDYQAASLREGRLDVPKEALGEEAFLFEGKIYGYFGPTPALLRVPIQLAGVGFGTLSRGFMVAYFIACLFAAYALLIHAARRLGGKDAWPARRHVVLLILGAGAGSSLFFLGSRAYVYHEAILCGAAFALWGTWASLRWLEREGRGRAWLPALICGVLAVHARPPAGLFALAVLGCTAALLLFRQIRSPQERGTAGALRFTAIGALTVVGVLSFNILSYLKFRSLDGAPLRYHVQYGPERLANIEGRNFHAGNVPYGLAGYLWRPNAELRPTFPYLFIHGNDPLDFPGSRIDLPENTLGIPWAMPTLSLLAALGFGVMWLRWPGATAPLAVLAGGVAPMAAALLAAVAQSHRYTADFVPFLIAAAAFGLAGTEALTPITRRSWLAIAAVLTPLAIAVTLAITVHYQGEGVWGVSEEIKARYLAMRRWSDHALGFKP
ncbi:MAG: hypothetical protein ACKOE8_01955 [Opitutaceae bacterium]